MRIAKNKKLFHLSLAVFLAVSSLTSLVFVQHAHAATLAQVMVRFDRMKQSTGTTGTVCAKPTTVASTEAKVVVTFPTGFTLGAFGTFTVSTTNIGWPTGGTAWPSITAPASGGDISGQSVTFGSGDLASGSTLYCFNWTSASALPNHPAPTHQNLVVLLQKPAHQPQSIPHSMLRQLSPTTRLWLPQPFPLPLPLR
jgi:hypothetical protein